MRLSQPLWNKPWNLQVTKNRKMTILPKKKASAAKNTDTEAGGEHGHGQVGHNRWSWWSCPAGHYPASMPTLCWRTIDDPNLYLILLLNYHHLESYVVIEAASKLNSNNWTCIMYASLYGFLTLFLMLHKNTFLYCTDFSHNVPTSLRNFQSTVAQCTFCQPSLTSLL